MLLEIPACTSSRIKFGVFQLSFFFYLIMFVNWVRVYMYFEILYHNPKILGEMMALNMLYEVKKIGGKAGKMPIHCTLL